MKENQNPLGKRLLIHYPKIFCYDFFSVERFLWKWYFDSLHCTSEDLWSSESVLSEKNKDPKKNILGGITSGHRILKHSHNPNIVKDPLYAFRRHFHAQSVFYTQKHIPLWNPIYPLVNPLLEVAKWVLKKINKILKKNVLGGITLG